MELVSYFPILVMLLTAAGFAATMIFISSLAGKKRPTESKEAPYECGSLPVGSARLRFGVKFYVIAILFILFELEVVFLWPWAVMHAEGALGLDGLIAVGFFAGMLVVGFVYDWAKGALDWE